jgi:oligopeptide/dipeptide ABC transporter ATP-binding protein
VSALLDIRNLSVVFDTEDGPAVAVDGVTLAVERGETLGLVGESGCGKSVTALSCLRLIPTPPGRILSGEVRFGGEDLLRLPVSELRRIRGQRIGMIFQEPMTALSPLHTIGSQLTETLRLHRRMRRREAWDSGVEWLRKVGMSDPAENMRAFPHQLSGGMRQRAMIAMALMLEPALLIADEPTTALDVTIQAQVLDLMRRMRGSETALLLITHDMGVVWEMCSRVAVMYAGEVVEIAPVQKLFSQPLHPYTEALLRSRPALHAPGGRLSAVPGQVPSALRLPAGCRFRDRCAYAFERCAAEHPALESLAEGRQARCFLASKRMAEVSRTESGVGGFGPQTGDENVTAA